MIPKASRERKFGRPTLLLALGILGLNMFASAADNLSTIDSSSFNQPVDDSH